MSGSDHRQVGSGIWPWRIFSFLLWYTREFVMANVHVTVDVLRPRKSRRMNPAIIAVPAASRTDAEWTMISSLITLTPGTLTLTFSREHRLLYVHGMFVDSREALVTEIQEMEDRMLGAMRKNPGDLTRPVVAPVVTPDDDPNPGAGEDPESAAEYGDSGGSDGR